MHSFPKNTGTFIHPSPTLSCSLPQSAPHPHPSYKGFSAEIFVQTGTAKRKELFGSCQFYENRVGAVQLPDKSMQKLPKSQLPAITS
ncbi:hypothetical protein CDAR_587611 [Caerostris darwini]|uniref:Uncharacterized protein n=1 Tax=Caerostris darwini TaxID=1538125 RepID=A0AAV4SN91_9ARAC|nr:hypothetical protein CDAR_587611 [Caerostris darwini]